MASEYEAAMEYFGILGSDRIIDGHKKILTVMHRLALQLELKALLYGDHGLTAKISPCDGEDVGSIPTGHPNFWRD